MNRGHRYRVRIGGEASGCTVAEFLARHYPHTSLVDWSDRVDAGLVRIDGRRVASEAPLPSGSLLTWDRPPWQEPEAPLAFDTIHEDQDLLVVAKPAGLPTLPGAGFLEHTLLFQVRRRHPEAAPLHRLGRWTSGLVVFARTARARSRLAASWRGGRVRKRYRARAGGSPSAERFTVSVPIGPVPHLRLGTVHAASPDGRPAHSTVRVVEREDGSFLADVEIATGRPHQIRIHLAAAGHPLVGDPLFVAGGRPAEGSRALPGDPGYALHAIELSLPHPGRPGRIELHCPPARSQRLYSPADGDGRASGPSLY